MSIKVQALVYCKAICFLGGVLPSTPLLWAILQIRFRSQGRLQKLLTAVFGVNEMAKPPCRPTERQRESRMGEKDEGDGTDLLIRWTRRGPEDRIPSLLPRLKFCAWEEFNVFKSQLHSVGECPPSLCPHGRAEEEAGVWTFLGWNQ